MKVFSQLMVALIILLAAESTSAQRLTYSADVSGVSNYIFRGQSLSDDGFAAQAGFNIANDFGWQYRFFVSSYDVNGDTDGRAEFSLAYRGEMDKYFDVMFGITAYGFESESKESTEWHLGLAAFDVSLVYHRDEERDTQYYDLAYFYQFSDEIRLDAHYGVAKPIYFSESSADYSLTGSYFWKPDLKFFLTVGSHDEFDSYGLVGATYFLD